MGKPSLEEQREVAKAQCPDLLRMLERFEGRNEPIEPRWVIRARREIMEELFEEWFTNYHEADHEQETDCHCT